jgi:hypothetical protein
VQQIPSQQKAVEAPIRAAGSGTDGANARGEKGTRVLVHVYVEGGEWRALWSEGKKVEVVLVSWFSGDTAAVDPVHNTNGDDGD